MVNSESGGETGAEMRKVFALGGGEPEHSKEPTLLWMVVVVGGGEVKQEKQEMAPPGEETN